MKVRYRLQLQPDVADPPHAPPHAEQEMVEGPPWHSEMAAPALEMLTRPACAKFILVQLEMKVNFLLLSLHTRNNVFPV